METNKTVFTNNSNLNRIYDNIYSYSEPVIKLLYDKYFRTDIYNEIINTPITELNKYTNNEGKARFASNHKWVTNKELKGLKVDDSTPVEHHIIEESSIHYLKTIIYAAKNMCISASLTYVTTCFVAFKYVLKKKKIPTNSILSRWLVFLIIINMYFPYSIAGRKKEKTFLEQRYAKELEKYTYIYKI